MKSTFFSLKDVEGILKRRSNVFIREFSPPLASHLIYRDIYGTYGFYTGDRFYETFSTTVMLLSPKGTPFHPMSRVSVLRSSWREFRRDEQFVYQGRKQQIFRRRQIAKRPKSAQAHFFTYNEMMLHLKRKARGLFIGHTSESEPKPIVGIDSDGNWCYGTVKVKKNNSRTTRMRYHPEQPNLTMLIRDQKKREILLWTLLGAHTIPSDELFGDNADIKFDTSRFH